MFNFHINILTVSSGLEPESEQVSNSYSSSGWAPVQYFKHNTRREHVLGGKVLDLGRVASAHEKKTH